MRSAADLSNRLAALRTRFLARLGEDERALRRIATAPGSREALGETIDIVHKLSGIAATMGYPEISEAARRCEMRLIAENPAHPSSDEFDALLAAMALAAHDAPTDQPQRLQPAPLP